MALPAWCAGLILYCSWPKNEPCGHATSAMGPYVPLVMGAWRARMLAACLADHWPSESPQYLGTGW
jgi:hypothetical protein